MTKLTIYSPAPPTTMLHALNADVARVINASVISMPLPQSINTIARLPEAEKRHHLPIVTSVDFLPARDGTGPPWHAYERANQDLKLVCALYDVAFGIMAFEPGELKGKRIGVPPRPSSVRVLTEALLRDGWGILDDVELVDLRPDEVDAALVHATSWNLLCRAPEGFVPLLPNLKGRWLNVSEECIAAINKANPFRIDAVPMSDATLLSFKQGLAAWDSTEDSLILSLLQGLARQGTGYAGVPANLQAMANWPSLTQDIVHAGALQSFKQRGIVIP